MNVREESIIHCTLRVPKNYSLSYWESKIIVWAYNLIKRNEFFLKKNYFYFNEGDVWLSKVVIKFSKLILELRETNKDCLVCGHMEN